MVLDLAQFETDLQNIIDDMPTVIVHNGTSYTGTKSMMETTKTVNDYGFAEDYSFTVACVKSDFTTLPKTGEKVTISGTQYRIMNPIEFDSAKIMMKLHLGAVYGKA